MGRWWIGGKKVRIADKFFVSRSGKGLTSRAFTLALPGLSLPGRPERHHIHTRFGRDLHSLFSTPTSRAFTSYLPGRRAITISTREIDDRPSSKQTTDRPVCSHYQQRRCPKRLKYYIDRLTRNTFLFSALMNAHITLIEVACQFITDPSAIITGITIVIFALLRDVDWRLLQVALVFIMVVRTDYFPTHTQTSPNQLLPSLKLVQLQRFPRKRGRLPIMKQENIH